MLVGIEAAGNSNCSRRSALHSTQSVVYTVTNEGARSYQTRALPWVSFLIRKLALDLGQLRLMLLGANVLPAVPTPLHVARLVVFTTLRITNARPVRLRVSLLKTVLFLARKMLTLCQGSRSRLEMNGFRHACHSG